MLLAIDAGNSNVKFALFEGAELKALWRVHSDPSRTSEEYAALLAPLFAECGLKFDVIDGVVIGSVVPRATPHLSALATDHFGTSPYIASASTAVGIAVEYEPPTSLGIDRLADAVAAAEFAGSPAIAVDLGTATTFNVVAPGANGPRFIGGAIAPGAGVLAETLSSRAAQLPAVGLIKPPTVIAQNSIHALQSGLFYGYASMIDGIVSRLRDELGDTTCPVIATGGGATEMLIAECRTITRIEPHLTLHGLRLLYERRSGL
jgi:type III pantothenate kinase